MDRRPRKTRRQRPMSIAYIPLLSLLLLWQTTVVGGQTTDAPVAPSVPNPPAPQPTRRPNPAPTPRPSAAPVPRPTFRPTRSPTLRPTLVPTRGPTLSPTRRPTPVPTPSPSSGPTRFPSRAPTFKPTPGPTRLPTTSSPSTSPSRRPTPLPTPSPSSRPSASPSQPPTPFPTLPPSIPPSGAPSDSPTFKPTTFTPKPTASAQPSPQPSVPPTSFPTTSPSDVPSRVPSVSPSGAPSSTPSNPPSLPLQRDFVTVDMLLQVVNGKFENRSALTYEQVTRSHTRLSILNQDFGDTPLVYLFVDTNLVDQRLILFTPAEPEPEIESSFNNTNSSNATLPPDGGRLLQEMFFLQVELDVQIDFRSEGQDFNAIEWIGDAFNSDTKREAYIRQLIRTGDPSFQLLTDVQLLVNGTRPPEEPTPSPTPSGEPATDASLIGIAVGASVGGLLMIGLGFLGYRRYSSSASSKEALLPSTSAASSSSPKVAISTEILVDRQDDISTLGDPLYGGMAIAAGERDERTASIGEDYDYTKQVRQAHGAESSVDESNRDRLTSLDSAKLTRVSSSQSGYSKAGLGPMGASVFADDASFEQQFAEQGQEERFEVDVPPGKLGMVIDTPNGGLPEVHALKSESILADRVAVGDKLLVVDGEDVTGMTALQVSKLISLKSDKQRLLVFSRNPHRLDTAEG